MTKVKTLTWSTITRVLIPTLGKRENIDLLGKRLYGVPRGGAVVAGLYATAYSGVSLADRPEDADVIVDDLYDSGRTCSEYVQRFPLKPFVCLVHKPAEGLLGTWIRFPWENDDPDADVGETVVRLLEYLGEDPKRDGLLETPKRFVKAMREMTCGYAQDPVALLGKTFECAHDDLVLVKRIPFWSLCEHHLLPFHGHATIGYIPGKQDGRVVGLSKIPRALHALARRLQVQERLTQQIVDALDVALKPQGAGAVLEAVHLCACARGVGVEAPMLTSSLRGLFRDDARTRAEFLSLAK